MSVSLLRTALVTVDMRGYGFDGSFYPIRTTVTNAVRNNETDIHWYQHPGYTVSVEDPPEPPEWYEPTAPLLSQRHLELRDGFAGAMRDTKICVVSLGWLSAFSVTPD